MSHRTFSSLLFNVSVNTLQIMGISLLIWHRLINCYLVRYMYTTRNRGESHQRRDTSTVLGTTILCTYLLFPIMSLYFIMCLCIYVITCVDIFQKNNKGFILYWQKYFITCSFCKTSNIIYYLFIYTYTCSLHTLNFKYNFCYYLRLVHHRHCHFAVCYISAVIKTEAVKKASSFNCWAWHPHSFKCQPPKGWVLL